MLKIGFMDYANLICLKSKLFRHGFAVFTMLTASQRHKETKLGYMLQVLLAVINFKANKFALKLQ